MERDESLASRHVAVGDRLVEFRRVACDYCGSWNEEPLFTGADRFLHLPGEFRLVRCRDCGLIRQNPQPTPDTIEAYYPPEYTPFALAIDDETSWLRRLDRGYGMRKRRRLVEGCTKTGRILDVGCATGNFLAQMRQTGRWTVVGIEPSEGAARYAIERGGLDVRVGRIEDVELPAASFDVITLWNVLEHLNRPIDDLRRLNRLLKPGGWLIFSLPNLESFEVRLFRERWFGWELPRHLYFFPRDVLARALGDVGLEVKHSVCLSGSQLSFALSLEYYAKDRPSGPAWPRMAASMMQSLPARLVLFPVFYAVDALRQSMILTYVAQKHS